MAELLQVEIQGFPVISFPVMLAAFWGLGYYLTGGMARRVSEPAERSRSIAVGVPPPAPARPAAAEQKLAA